MTILILLASLTVLGLLLAKNYKTELAGIIVTCFSGITFVMGLIMLPLNRMEVYADSFAFISVQKTIATARERGEKLENAAIQIKVAESNEWLASVQYWNQTPFDIWIPDAIEKLKPIE